MADTNEVKILEVFEVAPPSESTMELVLPLTYFDTTWLKFPGSETLYFFKLAEAQSTLTYLHSKIIPALKQALSQTLLHFLPLAGNLTWSSDQSSKPIFVYTPNDSVSLTVAVSSTVQDFDLVIGKKVRVAAKSHLYLPNLQISDDKVKLMALQITLFPSRGFSIGMTSHHAIIDGTSLAMFLKAWANICKHSCEKGETPYSSPPELTPSFDRTIIKDPLGLESAFLNQWIATPSEWLATPSDSSLIPRSLKPLEIPLKPNLYRATFQLTREDIKKVREKVLYYHQLAAGPNPIKQLHLSSFVLTYALVLVCMVRAIGVDSKKQSYMVFVVDCRSRLDPPIPPNYFGNCLISQHMVIEAGVCMKENGVALVSEKLGAYIKGLEKDLFEGAEERLVLLRKAGKEEHLISIAGSTNMDLYKLDFGWGRVDKVEITSIDNTNAFSIVESRDESGGIEIDVVLSKQEIGDFASHFFNGLNRELPKPRILSRL